MSIQEFFSLQIQQVSFSFSESINGSAMHLFTYCQIQHSISYALVKFIVLFKKSPTLRRNDTEGINF